jgi:hypothetical protein
LVQVILNTKTTFKDISSLLKKSCFNIRNKGTKNIPDLSLNNCRLPSVVYEVTAATVGLTAAVAVGLTDVVPLTVL